MNLTDKILRDLQEAMRARDKSRVQTLRLVRSAVKNQEIEKGELLEDEEVQDVFRREAKRRREAIEEYNSLNRLDLVEEAQIQLKILTEYLPHQMERSEIEVMAQQIVLDLGVNDISQLGEVMRCLMAQLKGQADGRLVHQIVKEIISDE